MSNSIISVEHLSKKYLIGENLQGRGARTFRDAFDYRLKHLFSRSEDRQRPGNTIWALRDVSFEIKEGEVVGIIGRNGAGKSTLLKIISRITEPTEGKVTLRGRVASLLEVGTGFNMELTGRENIYLNGAILGMRKAEIERKFDEIVDFAEVEKFIDTPVKRYSSGMYVRLAFAVAAHLEPDILVVDEVLAVGDVQFQKKCLTKLGQAGSEGRTVLFVSHNMVAIQSLCAKCCLIAGGRIDTFGESSEVINKYIHSDISPGAAVVRWNVGEAPGNDDFKLTQIRVYSAEETISNSFSSDLDIFIEYTFFLKRVDRALCVGFDLIDSAGAVAFRTYHTDLRAEDWIELSEGYNVLCCTIPKALLNQGTFYVCPRVSLHMLAWIINGGPMIQFEVDLRHGVSPYWATYKHPGVIAPVLEWKKGRQA